MASSNATVCHRAYIPTVRVGAVHPHLVRCAMLQANAPVVSGQESRATGGVSGPTGPTPSGPPTASRTRRALQGSLKMLGREEWEAWTRPGLNRVVDDRPYDGAVCSTKRPRSGPPRSTQAGLPLPFSLPKRLAARRARQRGRVGADALSRGLPVPRLPQRRPSRPTELLLLVTKNARRGFRYPPGRSSQNPLRDAGQEVRMARRGYIAT